MNSHTGKMNWRERFPAITNSEHWYQSTKPGKYRNKLSQMEFVQRKIKREREGFGPCACQITKECKAMLRNKIEQINFNSTLSSNKFRDYAFLIENGDRTYTIPWVHYALEVTLNILSIGLLRRQGFEISSNGDRCTLAYMFKDRRGKNINLDRMREQHNNYLEDYFDALDRIANIERRIEQPYEKKDEDVEIGNFHECVAFLDLIRKGGALSNEWEFEGDFEGLAEVLGLERSNGLDIRRCYLDYLEPLVSNYKAARSSNPTGGYGDEGIRRFEDYHGDGNKDGSTAAKEKGRVEHFGITLEKEEEGKCDVTAHQDEEDMARIKCYLCQKTGHFDFEYPNEDQRPTNGALTSRQQGEKDTHSSSSDDFTIIV
nr:ARID DNA-binding domain-containing protein [Tanacetum cinerariifolium]